MIFIRHSYATTRVDWMTLPKSPFIGEGVIPIENSHQLNHR